MACRDALNPKTVIADICDFLQNSLVSSHAISILIEQLQLVRTLAEQGASGASARTTLRTEISGVEHSKIAFGLYCWLSTPHAGHLAVSRAKQVQPELGAAIGAIAAAYAGNILHSDRQITEMGIAMGDRLLAAWAGVNDLQRLDAIVYAAVTAPDILGKRI
jgi:hypothetical protein